MVNVSTKNLTFFEFLLIFILFCHLMLSLLPLIVFLDAMYLTIQKSIQINSIIKISNIYFTLQLDKKLDKNHVQPSTSLLFSH